MDKRVVADILVEELKLVEELEDIKRDVNIDIDFNKFIDRLVEKRIFNSKKDVRMFILSELFEDVKTFDKTFPIKYYENKEEFYKDNYEVNEDDLEHMNEEYIANMQNQMM